mmetsp:Transcript_47400/g.71770  ORF Transcript_47400/g.71770 Transcript_47400/m.71770 type:complete len:91 (-) Transcript_47400:446-718(-)
MPLFQIITVLLRLARRPYNAADAGEVQIPDQSQNPSYAAVGASKNRRNDQNAIPSSFNESYRWEIEVNRICVSARVRMSMRELLHLSNLN